jgi:uncharacterized protein YbcC (UPF0753/DUF2309 family)
MAMSEHHHDNMQGILHELKHYLPAQASLKDFIHHNTLHAFQKEKFFPGIRRASAMLGYKVTLSLAEYRSLYQEGKISESAVEQVLASNKPADALTYWKDRMLTGIFPAEEQPRIGQLRSNWKRSYRIDLDSLVQPQLFRLLCSYLDQGISMWSFPAINLGFLSAIREIERLSKISFFKTTQARNFLFMPDTKLEDLLNILVGDQSLYKQYLFDQQFSHQGWSGMISVVEDMPETLLDRRKISLHDLVFIETLMEIDALEFKFGRGWKPLAENLKSTPIELFAPVTYSGLHEILELWQDAFERTYHDQVLDGIRHLSPEPVNTDLPSFQGLFCIDDRECSFRRYLEDLDPNCETFGTPGFFGVEFFFQPQDGKFVTKLCPAPVTPKFLIREENSSVKRESDPHFQKGSHGLFRGWLISQTLGFWSAAKLFINIFRPSMGPATASSFRHMDKHADLTIEHKPGMAAIDGLQVGFTKAEMVQRVEGLLKSIGLVKNFAPLVYVVGHGSSSVNNPHYAAYDCGACSGRAGSVNSRVLCHMANDAEVRAMLRERGIDIPDSTRFVGGLHDTTRDEIVFFDEQHLSADQLEQHRKHEANFNKALDRNAKERSRRLVSINTKKSAHEIHEDIKIRSVSLFEPRPELNHATNALCIVGRRGLTEGLFLDRRSFMNSFDYQVDPEGNFLFNILKAAAPVCGGINLEYFFSRTDNQKLGAGTKLPHNVMGLFGVANGIDGDLRPGLPSQMIEVHDPIRLMIIVEHFPDVILKTIQKNSETYEWFINEWVLLVSVNPEDRTIMKFKEGAFYPYALSCKGLDTVFDIDSLIESNEDNIPVHLIL